MDRRQAAELDLDRAITATREALVEAIAATSRLEAAQLALELARRELELLEASS